MCSFDRIGSALSLGQIYCNVSNLALQFVFLDNMCLLGRICFSRWPNVLQCLPSLDLPSVMISHYHSHRCMKGKYGVAKYLPYLLQNPALDRQIFFTSKSNSHGNVIMSGFQRKKIQRSKTASRGTNVTFVHIFRALFGRTC